MRTRISSKGQVVLPGAIRRKLGLRPGDFLDASVKSGQIVLTPRHARPAEAAIARDAITGLPVLRAGPGTPQLTSEQVQDILSLMKSTALLLRNATDHAWNVPMPIKLDWRFKMLGRIMEVRLEELRQFARQAEEQFARAVESWNEESAGLSAEEESIMADYFIERRDAIESLLDTGYTLGIVGLYTFIERFLNEVVDHLRAGGAPIPTSAKGFNFYQLRRQLGSVGIDLSAAPFAWNELAKFREVRNCIAHTNGWITTDFAKRLTALGLRVKPETELKLPNRYFQHCMTLVTETCEEVFTQAWAEFGYRRQYQVWLRPTCSFSNAEITAILKEATDVGIVARNKRTQSLLQQARRAGRGEEDSCGWVWLEIDATLLKQIHELKIPNISTNYKPMMIVEDCKLYLKDVADYQRMSASSSGMEAAAKILEKHGINAAVNQLTD